MAKFYGRLHLIPSVLRAPTVSVLKYKKRLPLRCIHQFNSDLIKSMDHMCISGTEPSSVLLANKLNFCYNVSFGFNLIWYICILGIAW